MSDEVRDVLHPVEKDDIMDCARLLCRSTSTYKVCLMIKQPSFQITYTIVNQVAEIAELTVRLSWANPLSGNEELRLDNRIRAIHGTLALEHDGLSLDQVRAIISGERLPVPAKDVAELGNACMAYERLNTLEPYSVDDLLTAQGLISQGPAGVGQLRSRMTGVAGQDGGQRYVPQQTTNLVDDLLSWAKMSPVHMLIRSCVLHYEFMRLQPFADRNGQMARLWHTLLLASWKPIFLWLPVEAVLYERREAYQEAVRASRRAGECSKFIEFMLSAVKDVLLEAAHSSTSDVRSDERAASTALRWGLIEDHLRQQGYIMNADVRELCGVSPATANRILAGLAAEGRIVKFRRGKHWAYRVADE